MKRWPNIEKETNQRNTHAAFSLLSLATKFSLASVLITDVAIVAL